MKPRHHLFLLGVLLLFAAPVAGWLMGDWAFVLLFVGGAGLFVSIAAVLVPPALKK
jgi:hypothetical protein